MSKHELFDGAFKSINELSTTIAKYEAECFDIPEWCPLVPLKKAKPYVNHGDHGPDPLFDGDAWTVWHCCGRCHHPVSHGDKYCRTCEAILDWDDDWGDTDG